MVSDLVNEYLHLLSDPAHTLVEFTFVLIDVVIIDAVRRRWNTRLDRRITAEHARIDAEHGITHEETR